MHPFYRQGSGVQRGEATFTQAKIICLPALAHVPEQNYSDVLMCAYTSTLPYTPKPAADTFHMQQPPPTHLLATQNALRFCSMIFLLFVALGTSMPSQSRAEHMLSTRVGYSFSFPRHKQELALHADAPRARVLPFGVSGDLPARKEPRASPGQMRRRGAGRRQPWQPSPLPGLASTAWLGRINK